MKLKKICLLLAVILFVSFTSCSSFEYEKNIVGKYYLIGVDLKDYLSISRKLNGDYIGRVPPNVIEYAIVDSLIVAKSEKNKMIRYYIVNMDNDSDYAKEEDFLTGPLSEREYTQLWDKKLKPKFIKVQ